jgi:hypothetical protein
MKIYSMYLALICLICICFVSCKKKDTPDDITEFCTKEVICYTVQGEPFVTDMPVLGEDGVALSGTQAQLQKVSYSTLAIVSLKITGYDAFKNTSFTIEISSPALHDSTYLFSESNISVAISSPETKIQNLFLWCNDYGARNTNGYVSITAIDTEAKLISGTFNVPITCYSINNEGSTILHENQMLTGQFDSISLIKTGGPW